MSTSLLVTAKINPDLDGVACAYAYSNLLSLQGENATGGIYGQMHAEAAFLVDHFGIRTIVHNPEGPFDSFVLVDASDMAGMPSVIRKEQVREVVDHREVHSANELFPNAIIQIEKVGSAATLIVEKYRASQHPIDSHSGVLLYGAIYSNTLNFQASIAVQRDRIAADWLQTQIAIPTSMIDDMFEAKTRFTFENLQKALEIDAKQFDVHKRRIGIAQLEIMHLQELAESRQSEILAALEFMKSRQQLDAVLLTAVDLAKNFTLFVTNDLSLQSDISTALQIDFQGNIAKSHGLLLRKQLVPILKEFGNRSSS